MLGFKLSAFVSGSSSRFLKGRAVDRFGITNTHILRNLRYLKRIIISVAELYELGS